MARRSGSKLREALLAPSPWPIIADLLVGLILPTRSEAIRHLGRIRRASGLHRRPGRQYGAWGIDEVEAIVFAIARDWGGIMPADIRKFPRWRSLTHQRIGRSVRRGRELLEQKPKHQVLEAAKPAIIAQPPETRLGWAKGLLRALAQAPVE